MRNPLRGARYANVTATLALVVALGGTSYAAATIGTADIKKSAVTSAKIKNGNVKAADLRGGAVTSVKIRDGAVTSGKIQDGAVQALDVADIAMQNLTLLNGWTPFSAQRGARFGKSVDGVVHLSGGVIQGGGFNGVIAVLPPGYRPNATAYMSTNLVAGSGPARIYIQSNGTVVVQATAPATTTDAQQFTSLDGVSFIP
ncbi:MAG: hypothetical protein ACK4V6_08985 [Microthrixaceae bacterium]